LAGAPVVLLPHVVAFLGQVVVALRLHFANVHRVHRALHDVLEAGFFGSVFRFLGRPLGGGEQEENQHDLVPALSELVRNDRFQWSNPALVH
jgi:hypothetical protein